MFKMDTLLYGPQGSGKTSIAKKLKEVLGHENIVDGLDSECWKDSYGKNTLFITNAETGDLKFSFRRSFRLLHIDDAIKLLEESEN